VTTLLLLLAGAGIVLAVQAVGFALVALRGWDWREAGSYWFGMTGWLIWIAPYLLDRRRHMRYRLHLKSPYDDPYE
jgi:hypothetical protein